MPEIRHYALGTQLAVSYPWGLYHGGRALCPDGKVRALKRIAQTADTFFSVPASVEVKGKTVAGYITVEATQGDPWIVSCETIQGYSTTATEEDSSLVVRFVPDADGKNGRIFK